MGLSAVSPARAGVILQFTTTNNNNNQYTGQSFTTPSGGPWDDITFNFFSGLGTGSVVPVAVGTAYIFSAPYTGTPSGLSSATDLATSIGILDAMGGEQGIYEFSPTFTLQPGTTYYLYSSGLMGFDVCQACGAGAYTATSGTSSFSVDPGDGQDFALGGNSVPEPTTIGLSALGVVFLLLAKRQERQDHKGRPSAGV